MIKQYPILGVTLLVAALTGCTTPREPIGLRQEKLERRLATQLDIQRTLSNRAERIHADLLAHAQEIRDLKEQANRLTLAIETNRMAIDAIAADLPGHRTAVQDVERRIAEESTRVKELQSALDQERAARERAVAEARSTAERQAKEEREKALDQEQAARREQDRTRAESAKTRSNVGPADVKNLPPPAPNPATRLIADAQTALNRKNIDQAEKLYGEALAAAPGMMAARVGLAACRYERGDLDEATRLVSAVLKDDPRHAQALGLRGLLHWRKGELASAEEVLGLAVKERGNDSQLQNYLGIVLYERKKSDDAIRALRRAIEIDEQNAEAHYNLSVVLATAAKPDLKAAAEQYRRALKLGTAPDPAMEKLLKN